MSPNTGQTVEAAFLGVEGELVLLRTMSERTEFKYPLESLSDVDQEVVRKLVVQTASAARSTN